MKILHKALAIALFALLVTGAQAKEVKFLNDGHGVAASGYDVVAYFANQATRGIPGIEVEYSGLTWYFETQANADKFQSDPERYVPQYGGYCAYGVTQGYLVSVDPEAWSVIDGKLYLNYNQTIRSRWLGRANDFIAIAEKHWPRLSSAY